MSNGCDKCGNPDIYKKWDKVKLCEICYEDLAAEARSVNEDIAKDRLCEK